jgi:hypothetical protein
MKELLEVEGPALTDQELQEIVLAVMTSRMRQKGARYNLPESMLMEIGKRCFDKGYNPVVKPSKIQQSE